MCNERHVSTWFQSHYAEHASQLAQCSAAMEQFPSVRIENGSSVLYVPVADNGMVAVCPNCEARFENGRSTDASNKPLSALCSAHAHFGNSNGCPGKSDRVIRCVLQPGYVSYGHAPAIPLGDYKLVAPYHKVYETIETQVGKVLASEWRKAAADKEWYRQALAEATQEKVGLASATDIASPNKFYKCELHTTGQDRPRIEGPANRCYSCKPEAASSGEAAEQL